MKRQTKLLSILLTLTLVLSCTAFAADSGRAINAYKAPEDIIIDGDLSEWNTTSPATINLEEQVVRDPGQWKEKGVEDLSLDIYVMWDEENLYLGAKILDDTPFMYREGFPPDMADSLVLFLSTDPEADPTRTSYTANDWRVTMIIDDYYYNTGIDRDMIEDNKGFETCGEDGDEQVLEDYEACIAEIEGGYTLEIKIPLINLSNENIPVLVPAAGMVVGVDFGMFDLDFPCPGVATVRMQWAGTDTVDTDPSQWGSMTFCD
ncbi:MAG: sugar-binding protein [Christensenellales bacterium]|jgi:hypothetical protein|nr:hypothetical protein [Clostridiales bacterium]